MTDLLPPSSVSSKDDALDVSVGMGRRSFLTRSAAVAVGATGAALGFEALAANPVQARRRGDGGYGDLRPVKDENTGEELLQLPRGFEYISFGWTGDVMDDGIPTPSAHDGMAAFGSGKKVRLVRNHEQSSGPAYASGMTYDPAAAGGTTNLVFDTRWGGSTSPMPAWPARSATAAAARHRGAAGSPARRPRSCRATSSTATCSTCPPTACRRASRSSGWDASRTRPRRSIPRRASSICPRTPPRRACTASSPSATAT